MGLIFAPAPSIISLLHKDSPEKDVLVLPLSPAHGVHLDAS